MSRVLSFVLALCAVLSVGAVSPVSAQTYREPGYGYDQTFRGGHHLQGFVTAFSGYNLVVRIHGIAQPVNLHHGTVLQPLGLTMVPGMLVRCDGYFNSGGLFIAEVITLVR